MSRDFEQNVWDETLNAHWAKLVRLAIEEDLGELGDRTTQALVPEDARGRAAVVVRKHGVIAGLPGVEGVLKQIDSRLRWLPQREDGQVVASGTRLGQIDGPARALLSAERLVLNLLGRLSGIATLTRRYVEAVAGTRARIYDTRKTIPGWRRLEKYAVRQGGGRNHRTGLFDAVLIKDNHLAFGNVGSVAEVPASKFSPAEAVLRARLFLQQTSPPHPVPLVEIEVDTLEQLADVLAAGPDVVLLDNMPQAMLREAVALRDAKNPAVELEASGNVDLTTVRAIAETGVERISAGALTHSAVNLDVGLDWLA